MLIHTGLLYSSQREQLLQSKQIYTTRNAHLGAENFLKKYSDYSNTMLESVSEIEEPFGLSINLFLKTQCQQGDASKRSPPLADNVAENSSTAHDRFRPSSGSSGTFSRLETSKAGDSAGFQISKWSKWNRRCGSDYSVPRCCLAIRILSQILCSRTLIVLLSRSGSPGSIRAHVQPRIEHTQNRLSHRPSRGATSRVVLLAAYSRASSSVRTDDSVRFALMLAEKAARHPMLTSSGISKSIFKLRHPVYMSDFNVHTQKQTGQQAAHSLTVDLLDINVSCLAETRIQDASTVVEPAAHLWLLRQDGQNDSCLFGYPLIVASVRFAWKHPWRSLTSKSLIVVCLSCLLTSQLTVSLHHQKQLLGHLECFVVMS
ncbi:hypothetical protein CSKR_100733 [Clonorchis sinensis]|uniref:Uncharacterized protein n=1 Tax=Clonorchis sinensis TaxID=79923 RepID=A0A419PKY6_CLOSI|nr:hypothetical protein CSKR_100733 [Clonorchis sinensis]